MKRKKRQSLQLKKVVIARLDNDLMRKIKGGDCIPTEHEPPSHHVCPPGVEVY